MCTWHHIISKLMILASCKENAFSSYFIYIPINICVRTFRQVNTSWKAPLYFLSDVSNILRQAFTHTYVTVNLVRVGFLSRVQRRNKHVWTKAFEMNCFPTKNFALFSFGVMQSNKNCHLVLPNSFLHIYQGMKVKSQRICCYFLRRQ